MKPEERIEFWPGECPCGSGYFAYFGLDSNGKLVRTHYCIICTPKKETEEDSSSERSEVRVK